MKNFFFSVLMILFAHNFLLAQVPNSSFETWTSGSPDGWITNNVPNIVTTISQSNSSHTGSFAAKGEVESVVGSPYAPVLFSGDANGNGFPVNTRYNSMKGYFKFNPVGGDILFVAVGLTLNGETIGAGVIEISSSIADYTEINFPIIYDGAGTPDSAIIVITIEGPSGNDFHLGSEFYADDLSLSTAVVAVEDNKQLPSEFRLEQNYPNPFNPVTSINYQVPQRSFVNIKVYNILGNEVANLVNESREAGSYSVKFDASELPSGVYIYSIEAGNFKSSKKMILTK